MWAHFCLSIKYTIVVCHLCKWHVLYLFLTGARTWRENIFSSTVLSFFILFRFFMFGIARVFMIFATILIHKFCTKLVCNKRLLHTILDFMCVNYLEEWAEINSILSCLSLEGLFVYPNMSSSSGNVWGSGEGTPAFSSAQQAFIPCGQRGV